MAAARNQMDRLERMTEDVVSRIDQTVHTLQTYVLNPARQGAALLAGARAAVLGIPAAAVPALALLLLRVLRALFEELADFVLDVGLVHEAEVFRGDLAVAVDQ